ncbi:EpsG family protein [Photobacterium carnosum]|uniref:EpsG family protein n=1 Tax=Photobacterium carnosum TaxID=2023717 RepID=UPI00128B16C4|nr:EpsG family protein [Photobacterium carnosum]KAE8177961.1 hypothetical protein CIT27_04260 [Photobacterium carnosum]
MLIYYFFILICFPLGYAYNKSNENLKKFIMFFYMLSFVAIFGFRYEVGVDWFNYILAFHRYLDTDFFSSFELGYKGINYLAYYLGFDIQFVIFFVTVLFVLFTFLGAKKLALNPFYFFIIIAPFHFIMSGMNYTRQAVALSIFVFSLSYLIKGDKYKFLFFIIVAATFHTSALCFIPLFFIEQKKRYSIIVLLTILPIIIIKMLNEYSQYTTGTMQSSGFYLRFLFLIIPVIMMLVNYKKITNIKSLIIIRLFFVSCFSIPFVMFISFISTTIADRFSYYFILYNVIIYLLVTNNEKRMKFENIFVIFCSYIGLFTWVTFTRYIHLYEFKYLFFRG